MDMFINKEHYFYVDFADQKNVEIRSIEIKDIYSGLLAGKRSDFTAHILNSSKKSTTYFTLTNDQLEPDKSEPTLRPYKYLLTARKYVCEMKVLWFDYASPELSLKELISKRVANIRFDDYAEEINW